jgi:DNA-directed RNA polymerase specialized sigma24 family protein
MAWREAGGRRDEELCKDICAETIAIAYEQFSSLRSTTALLSYCFTIATRLHRTYRIKSHRVAYSLSEPAFAGVEADDTAEHLTEQSADVAILYDALDTLPSEQREAVIADVQARSVTSVEVSVSRGRTLLAKRLGAR